MIPSAIYVFEEVKSDFYLMIEHKGKNIPEFPGVCKHGKYKGQFCMQRSILADYSYEFYNFNRLTIPNLFFLNNKAWSTYLKYGVLVEEITSKQIKMAFFKDTIDTISIAYRYWFDGCLIINMDDIPDPLEADLTEALQY